MINVIGLGYIGLPTALMFASHGVYVVGTDYNKDLVAELNVGRTTFKENELDTLFEEACEKGITFTSEYQVTDTYIIAVPTPYNKVSKKIDVSFVINALDRVLDVCKRGSIIIIESTLSPSATDTSIRPALKERGVRLGQDIHLVHCPERIIPGNMVYELEHNDRVIGADDVLVGNKVKDLYAKFCKGEIVVTDIKTAEMTKVVENTYRDINIAYANELAKICRRENMDVYKIIKIANMHPRVNILSPGPGVGGHCIPVDPWFLVGDFPDLANLIWQARKINDSMPEFVLERIRDIMKEQSITDVSRVGLYGLTYKENVDDVRESPTIQLLECMSKHLAPGLKVYDPCVKKDLVANQYHDFDQFLEDVDFVVIMVAHSEIRDYIEKLSDKIILDTRNVSDLPNTYRL